MERKLDHAMRLTISPEAKRFVSHFNPQELADIRAYLLAGTQVERGSLSVLEMMILDSMKKKRKRICLQICIRIDQVLAATEVA